MADISFIQILLVFIVTFIAAIDQFNFLESLYQPIVTGPCYWMDFGRCTDGAYCWRNLSINYNRKYASWRGSTTKCCYGWYYGYCACYFSWTGPNEAVGAAIPFALLGQYGITLLFTGMSPMMTKADSYAQEANTKGIDRLNYTAMGILGLIFGLIVTVFFVGGASFGQQLLDLIPAWIMTGLEAAGGMMRFVGFAILLKVMISRPLWGFYFMGFALAIIVNTVGDLGSSALLILSFIGFALAFWDYQLQTKIRTSATSVSDLGDGEDEQDGI